MTPSLTKLPTLKALDVAKRGSRVGVERELSSLCGSQLRSYRHVSEVAGKLAVP